MDGCNKYRFQFFEVDGAGAAPSVEVKEFENDARELEGTLETTIEEATTAAAAAPGESEHAIMASVAEALELVRAELKRANDNREFEQKKIDEATAAAAVTEAPVAEVVDESPPVQYVRRGARKVVKR